jgi:putative transposase
VRFARVVLPGCPHHVLARGNRKAAIFSDDSDRLVYSRLMQQASENSHLSIWAYVLMDNHVHFVAIPGRADSLGKAIKEAHEAYTMYFNTKYGLVGHAWQNRFKSFPMDWGHCLNAIRYVERNPVRAGMVNKAEDYLWSSAAAHCRLRDDVLLTDDCPLVTEIANWSEWLGIGNPNEIEYAIRRHTRIGRPLGPTEFLISAETQTGRKLLPRKRGPRLKSAPIPTDSDKTEPSGFLFG